MNLLPTLEQHALIEAAAAFADKELLAPDGLPATSVDAATWSRTAELGWLGLGLPEEAGGVGASLAEEALLHQELGRRLVPGPFIATTLAARVAIGGGETALATRLIAGEVRCGVAAGDLGIDVEVGHLALVIDASCATLLEVDGIEPDVPVDVGSSVSTVTLGAAVTAVEGRAVFDRGHVLVAAQLVGIAEACRDMSAAYAATRMQFGRPIGSFQAVKHRCAEMVVRCETARSLTNMAALLVGADRGDGAVYASSALTLAAAAAVRNASDNIQNHGGIGVTTELGAERYVTRALTLRRLLSEPAWRHHDVAGAGPTCFS